MPDLRTRGLDSLRAIHDEIRPLALFRIGQLPRQQSLQPVHADPALQEPCALHVRRRRDHHHGIDALVPAGLEQQRDIEHDHLGTGGLSLAKELGLGSAHQRMHDLLQPPQRLLVAGDALAKRGTVDLAVLGHTRKRRFDRRDRRTFVKPVDRGIGVVHRHALLREQPRGRRFSHRDGTGEADDEHRIHFASSPALRSHFSSANSGRPSTVK